VRAAFNHLAGFQNHDRVGLMHGRQAVRDDDRRASDRRLLQRVAEQRFDSASSALVASSRSRISALRSMARAIEIAGAGRPTTGRRSRPPPSRSPRLRDDEIVCVAALAAVITSSSVASCRPRRMLCMIVPANRKVSWPT
jgi:hypothetical protein